MTREEAIGKWIYPAITTMWNENKCKEILEALEQEPCDDAISRQAVEKITWEEPSYTDALNVLTEVRDKVRALPSVNPQEPVLDKIRAEIKHHSEHFINDDGDDCLAVYEDDVFEIIDKYREGEKNDTN